MAEQELPTGWIDTTLGEIAVPKSGKVYPKSDSTLKFLGMDCIEPNALKPHHFYEFSTMKSQASLFVDGDVLYGRMRPYLNKVWKADSSGACSSEFIVFMHSEYVDSDFLKFILHHQSFVNFASRSSSGDRPRVDFKRDLQGYNLWLPPLNEQQRIVSKVEELFSRLNEGEAALRRVQRLLTRYRQAVLKAAVTGELTKEWRDANQHHLESSADLLQRILQDRRVQWQGRGKYEEPQPADKRVLQELPAGWVWVRMEQLAYVMGGLTKNAKRKYLPLTRPMLRVANVYQNRLELNDVHEIGVNESELERVTLQMGDMLIVEGNGSKDQIGRMAIWNGQIPNCIHQNHLIKARFVDTRLAKYAMTWFCSHKGREIIENVASSTSGLHTLSLSKVDELVVPLPSLEEAEEIVNQVDDILSRIDALEAWCDTELARCATLRQSILKAAFSGQLVEQDPTDEPASALLQRIQSARQTPTAKPIARPLSKEQGKRTPKQQPTLWEPT